MHATEIEQACRAIELLVLDVDGVLTDGRIIYSELAGEQKEFHVRDGYGMTMWQRLGKKLAIITGRASPMVTRRAAELGIEFVQQGCSDKLQAYRSLLQQSGCTPQQACCMGDDLSELPLLKQCGFGVAVHDAATEVRAAAGYVTTLPGGFGAVREVIELILRAQGVWQSHVAHLNQLQL